MHSISNEDIMQVDRPTIPSASASVPTRRVSSRRAQATKLGKNGRMCWLLTESCRLMVPRPSYLLIASTCTMVYCLGSLLSTKSCGWATGLQRHPWSDIYHQEAINHGMYCPMRETALLWWYVRAFTAGRVLWGSEPALSLVVTKGPTDHILVVSCEGTARLLCQWLQLCRDSAPCPGCSA